MAEVYFTPKSQNAPVANGDRTVFGAANPNPGGGVVMGGSGRPAKNITRAHKPVFPGAPIQSDPGDAGTGA